MKRVHKQDLFNIAYNLAKIIYKEVERTYYFIGKDEDCLATFDCNLEICTTKFVWGAGKLLSFESEDLSRAAGKIGIENTMVVYGAKRKTDMQISPFNLNDVYKDIELANINSSQYTYLIKKASSNVNAVLVYDIESNNFTLLSGLDTFVTFYIEDLTYGSLKAKLKEYSISIK